MLLLVFALERLTCLYTQHGRRLTGRQRDGEESLGATNKTRLNFLASDCVTFSRTVLRAPAWRTGANESGKVWAGLFGD